MVHFSKFSFISLYSDKHREITFFAHNYSINNNKQSNSLSDISIQYIFLQKEISYLISITINTNIHCLTNSMSVFGVFSKQQQGALKVCCSEFSVRFTVSGEFSTESSVAECVSCIQDQEYVRKRPLGDPEDCSEVNLTVPFFELLEPVVVVVSV